jgi:glycosyltransferase involved in cell wall biosynthesis
MDSLKQQPLVSVVVTVYNGSPHYSTCYASLCRLAYPADRLEVHIVDDYSTDGTREFLQQQEPPGFITLHYTEENLGRTRVCNLALKHATGDVVIFLDGDMEVHPDFVGHHVRELTQPGREAIIGRVEPAPWVPRTKLNRYLYESPLRGAQQFGPDRPISFQYLLFGNAALSRAAVEAGGSFDESFTHYGGKDITFAYRVARKFPNGIFYGPEAVSYHHENRPLATHLRMLNGYGYHNLSQIMQRHPEIATPLAADYAWPFPDPYFSRKRRKGRLLFNTLTTTLARIILPLTPFPLSNALVRFSIVASVVRGLRQYVRDHSIKAIPPIMPLSPPND